MGKGAFEAKRCGVGRSQFDSERYAVETTTDRRNRRKVLPMRRKIRVLCLRPSDETLNGALLKDILWLLWIFGRHIERWNAIGVLAVDPQGLSACRQNRSARTHTQNRLGHSGCGVNDVFAIVEHKQKFSSSNDS